MLRAEVNLINLFLQTYFLFKSLIHLNLVSLCEVLRCFRNCALLLRLFDLKLSSERFNLLAELGYDLCVVLNVKVDIEHIPFDDSFDLFRSIRIFQRVSGVLKRNPSRGDISYHYCSTVSSQ